jgi:hypothetical protein
MYVLALKQYYLLSAVRFTWCACDFLHIDDVTAPGLQPSICLPIEGIFAVVQFYGLVLVLICDCGTNVVIVYAIRECNMLVVLQRSLCCQGCQRLFSEQLYALMEEEFRCIGIVALTGASSEDSEPDSR